MNLRMRRDQSLGRPPLEEVARLTVPGRCLGSTRRMKCPVEQVPFGVAFGFMIFQF